MAAKLGGEDDEAIVDINITPFVDIILVVLIIFMVTATYITEKSIKVDLPDAATGEGTESTSLAINMDASEQLLNGNPITAKALRTEFKSQATHRRRRQADGCCLSIERSQCVSWQSGWYNRLGQTRGY